MSYGLILKLGEYLTLHDFWQENCLKFKMEEACDFTNFIKLCGFMAFLEVNSCNGCIICVQYLFLCWII